MAKLNKNFPTLMALLALMVAAAMLPIPADAEEDNAEISGPDPEGSSSDVEVKSESIAPSPFQNLPAIKVTIPPEPEPGLYDYLQECTKKLTRDCGQMIVKSIFEKTPTSSNCCLQLLHLGKTCHDDMFKFLVSLPELHLNGPYVFAKADRVWYQCVKTAAATAAPSPGLRI